MKKYIFVTGGVLSGLGKGIAAASIGHLLSYKYNVVPIKLDGYLNTDPGTMNPQEHGEVFVLEDGSEVDMDFGHYERFMGCVCTKEQSLTMGKIFAEVQEKERRGDYLGKTVQMVPHVTDLIKEKIKAVGSNSGADVVIVEVGGTIGDIENELFVEAARQLAQEVGEENSLFVHLTYIPIPEHVDEEKSKPTQQSVKLLLERGIKPNIIIGRCQNPLSERIKKKIALFCNVPYDAVVSGHDVQNIYEIPEMYYKQGILSQISLKLGLNIPPLNLKWPKFTENLKNLEGEIKIAICGKYAALEDSYASVIESLRHCSAHIKRKINFEVIGTDDLENQDDVRKVLEGFDGVIVPGGFGNRGIKGKMEIIKYVRENNVPFLGICLGLQLAILEFLRNVGGMPEAESQEFNPDSESLAIVYLPGQHKDIDMGGTMRLGAYEAILNYDSKISEIYDGKMKVSERHRHRYEVNPDYHEILKKKGLDLCGFSPDGKLVEFICLKEHPYFVATQAHPELKSKLESPSELFLGLTRAAAERKFGSSENL